MATGHAYSRRPGPSRCLLTFASIAARWQASRQAYRRYGLRSYPVPSPHSHTPTPDQPPPIAAPAASCKRGIFPAAHNPPTHTHTPPQPFAASFLDAGHGCQHPRADTPRACLRRTGHASAPHAESATADHEPPASIVCRVPPRHPSTGWPGA
jgi:hypothetical protein